MKNKKNNNRSFGLLFFVVFLIIGLYPMYNENNPNIYFIILSLPFLVLGLLDSKILTPLNKLWFKFGLLLGKIISPLIMGFIFFIVVTPIGILMRIFKKDLLNLKFNNKRSYWVEKTEPKSKMKNQF